MARDKSILQECQSFCDWTSSVVFTLDVPFFWSTLIDALLISSGLGVGPGPWGGWCAGVTLTAVFNIFWTCLITSHGSFDMVQAAGNFSPDIFTFFFLAGDTSGRVHKSSRDGVLCLETVSMWCCGTFVVVTGGKSSSKYSPLHISRPAPCDEDGHCASCCDDNVRDPTSSSLGSEWVPCILSFCQFWGWWKYRFSLWQIIFHLVAINVIISDDFIGNNWFHGFQFVQISLGAPW